MADPKNALASIGKSYSKRIGPSRMISAIRKDLIKVNFDPSKISAHVRMMARPKSPDNLHKSKFNLAEVQKIQKSVEESKKLLIDPDIHASLSRSGSLSRRASLKSKHSLLGSKHSSASSFGKLTPKSSLKSVHSRTEEKELPPPGFRYHSNGDIRVSKSNSSGRRSIGRSSEVFMYNTESVTAQKILEIERKRSHLVNAMPPRSFTDLLQKSTTGSSIAGNRRASETTTGMASRGLVNLQMRRKSEPSIGSAQRSGAHLSAASRFSSARAISFQDRRSYEDLHAARNGDNMYKQTILQHMRDMAQSSEAASHTRTRFQSNTSLGTCASGDQFKTSAHRGPTAERPTSGQSRRSSKSNQETMFQSEHAQSSPGPRSMSRSLSQHGNYTSPGLVDSGVYPSPLDVEECGASSSLGGCLTAGNSSFNMRYGVPVKLMAQRKLVLDEKHSVELESTYKNDVDIERFLHTASTVKQVSKQITKKGSGKPWTGIPKIAGVDLDDF